MFLQSLQKNVAHISKLNSIELCLWLQEWPFLSPVVFLILKIVHVNKQWTLYLYRLWRTFSFCPSYWQTHRTQQEKCSKKKKLQNNMTSTKLAHSKFPSSQNLPPEVRFDPCRQTTLSLEQNLGISSFSIHRHTSTTKQSANTTFKKF